jgi:hypothetical protein
VQRWWRRVKRAFGQKARRVDETFVGIDGKRWAVKVKGGD